MVFDVSELRNFKMSIKNKATVTLRIMYQYFHQGAVGDILLFPMAIVEDVIHRCGAFGVARFDRQGNAKAMIRGTGDRLGSTLFYYL